MKYYYEAYGLFIACNKKLPLLAPAHNSHVDVSINLSNQSLPEELSLITQRQPDSTENDIKLWQTPKWHCIEYARSANHALRFYISKDGSKVVSSKPDAIPSSDVDSFVLGPILGFVLRLQDRICLHASVLESNGKAFAMIGHKGAGKSTTAAALLEAGAQLISDDIAAIHKSETGTFTVEPGYAGIRLIPDALATFGLNQHDYKPVVSNNDKRIIPLSIQQSNNHVHQGWRFQPQASQLKAIYILNKRQPDLKSIQITTLFNTQACIELAPHSYPRRVINKQQQNQEFAFMAQLTRRIPIKSVDRPDNLSCLPRIAEGLLSDLSCIT